MSHFPWKIISSRSLIRAITLLAAALLTGNVLFSCYYFLGPSYKTQDIGEVQAVQVEQILVVAANKAKIPRNVRQMLSSKGDPIHSTAPPVDEQTKFVHKIYWELVKRNASKVVSERWLDLKSERDILKAIFDDGALWGDYRANVPRRNVHGMETKYDSHLILQQVWQQTALDIYPELFESNETKKIVIRDSFSWWGYNGNENLHCASHFNKKCTLKEGHDLSDTDAVIAVRDGFHRQDFYVGRDVFRIYFIQESPFAAPDTRFLRRNDLLASYWRGSELPARYANWVYYDPSLRTKPQSKNYASGKTRLAAIFMSNCMSTNKRLTVVDALRQYVPIDVYGVCGDGEFVCERHEQETCFQRLKKDYFFYLAFENSNCRDYVTEKFFINALQNDVVPVVLGAHPNDYASLAPAKSFIVAEDFESVKALAQYLRDLTKNEKAYNAYFEWKGTGEFVGSDFFCRVCSMLWYAEVSPPPQRRTVMFWAPDDNDKNPMCLSPGKQSWRKWEENH